MGEEQDKQARQEAAITARIERAKEKEAKRAQAEKDLKLDELPTLTNEDVLAEMRRFSVKNLKLMNAGIDIAGREKTALYKLVELLAKFEKNAKDGESDVGEADAHKLLTAFKKHTGKNVAEPQ